MTGVRDQPELGSQAANPDTVRLPSGDKIDPFLLDIPIADPATLPVFTLEPDQVRAMRDREDPITAHRTRRNR